MTAVMILGYMEAADVNVKVDVTFLEIGGMCSPYFCVGISRLDRPPSLTADTATDFIPANIKKIERIVLRLGVYPQDHSANPTSVLQNAMHHGHWER